MAEEKKFYVLGRGILYNPKGEGVNEQYHFVGLADEEGNWINIKPFANGPGWLQTLGPGRLIFLPDSSLRSRKKRTRKNNDE